MGWTLVAAAFYKVGISTFVRVLAYLKLFPFVSGLTRTHLLHLQNYFIHQFALSLLTRYVRASQPLCEFWHLWNMKAERWAETTDHCWAVKTDFQKASSFVQILDRCLAVKMGLLVARQPQIGKKRGC